MTAVLVLSPNTNPQINSTVSLVGTGFDDHRTRLSLDGTVFATVCDVPAGTFTVDMMVGGTVTTQTAEAEQLVAGTWSSVATLSVDVVDSGGSTSSGETVTTNSRTIQNETIDGPGQLIASFRRPGRRARSGPRSRA